MAVFMRVLCFSPVESQREVSELSQCFHNSIVVLISYTDTHMYRPPETFLDLLNPVELKSIIDTDKKEKGIVTSQTNVLS